MAPVCRSSHQFCGPGPDAVGPDHHPGSRSDLAAVALGDDPLHLAVGAADQVDHPGSTREVGAGVLCRLDEDAVEQMAPGGVEGVDVALGANTEVDPLLPEAEGDFPDRRSSCLHHSIQHSPSLQLEDAGAEHGMGRHHI